MKCQDIMSALEELSPVSYAEDWDNVGHDLVTIDRIRISRKDG